MWICRVNIWEKKFREQLYHAFMAAVKPWRSAHNLKRKRWAAPLKKVFMVLRYSGKCFFLTGGELIFLSEQPPHLNLWSHAANFNLSSLWSLRRTTIPYGQSHFSTCWQLRFILPWNQTVDGISSLRIAAERFGWEERRNFCAVPNNAASNK